MVLPAEFFDPAEAEFAGAGAVVVEAAAGEGCVTEGVHFALDLAVVFTVMCEEQLFGGMDGVHGVNARCTMHDAKLLR